jgi:hypothetical protein
MDSTPVQCEWRPAANAKAWAIGARVRNGFRVRRVVWGLLMAVSEKRPGEEIRACRLMVEALPKRRTLPKLFESRSEQG